MNWNKEAEI